MASTKNRRSEINIIKVEHFIHLLLAVLVIGLTISFVEAQKRKPRPRKTTTVVEYREVSGDERRKMIEARMLKGEYQHDGSGDLLYIGTIESVPALLQVLKDHPPWIREIEPLPPPIGGPKPVAPKPQKIVICTYAHAAAALRKITGQNFEDYDEWRAWWEMYKAN